jgi:hypothetical protein
MNGRLALWVTAYPPAGRPDLQASQRYVDLGGCGDVSRVDLVLPPTPVQPPAVQVYGSIEGVVTDMETGAPVPGVNIFGQVTGPDGYYRTPPFHIGWEPTTSATMGSWVYAPAPYFMAHVYAVAQKDTTVRFDHQILRQRSSILEGRVYDLATGEPIAGAQVGGRTTDADGYYRHDVPLSSGVPRNGPVVGTVGTSAAGYWYRTSDYQVRDGEVTRLDIGMLRQCTPATVTGVVLNAATREPLPGASVWAGAGWVTTDQDGRFTSPPIGMQAGNTPWKFTMSASKEGFVSQSKDVNVFCGGWIFVEFAPVASQTGVYEGRVTSSATGDPIAGLVVGAGFGAYGTTDANGDYRIEGAPLNVENADRDWELRVKASALRFNQSRAVAIDMESGTIAAQGYRFRVPYGTLLCVSDKPLHGELKLPGMANRFYERAISEHMRIGIATVEELKRAGHRLHSRKLRAFDEPPFR